MIRLLIASGLAAIAALFGAVSAQADPDPGPYMPGPGKCQFLGQNFNVYYPCTQYQPWLPYGTGNNPPLGGSAVTPGGDGPTVNGREPGWSGPNCPACSS